MLCLRCCTCGQACTVLARSHAIPSWGCAMQFMHACALSSVQVHFTCTHACTQAVSCGGVGIANRAQHTPVYGCAWAVHALICYSSHRLHRQQICSLERTEVVTIHVLVASLPLVAMPTKLLQQQDWRLLLYIRRCRTCQLYEQHPASVKGLSPSRSSQRGMLLETQGEREVKRSI